MDRALAAAVATTAHTLSAPALLALRERLAGEVEAGRLPGAVVALWLDGRPAFQCDVGWLYRAAGRPMRADALFRIYSMTKPLASVAAMMLVQDGRLALHDDVAERLAGWPRRGISVLDLLMHTSGLTYGQRQPPGELRSAYQRLGVRLNPRDMPREHFLQGLAQLPLAATPGTRWDYGHSTDLLGLVIEAVSGQRLGHFLRERLFAPLGMHDTGFAVAPRDAHRLAQPLPHDPVDGSVLEVPDQTFDPTAPALMDSAGAGAISTVADYGCFANFLLAGGRSAGGHVLLRADLLAEMMRDHLAERGILAEPSPGEAALLSPGYGFGYGLAVRLPGPGANLPGTPGTCLWSGTAGTLFWVDPALRLAAVYMTQAPGASRQHYRRLITELVYAAVAPSHA